VGGSEQHSSRAARCWPGSGGGKGSRSLVVISKWGEKALAGQRGAGLSVGRWEGGWVGLKGVGV